MDPLLPQPLLTLLGALAVLSAVLATGYLAATLRARRLDRQRAELLDEIGLLQRALLPEVPLLVGAVQVSVAYRPADGPAAGGDFYDALTLSDGRAAFILGDVCGHGRQALARTAFVRFTVRAYIEAGLPPRRALQVAGAVIDEHMGGEFATVVVAVHDRAAGSLTYACAGHPPPLVVGPSRPEAVLTAASPPVGLGLRTGLRQTTLPLPPSSVVCLYTDGLAEARVTDGILGRPALGDIVADLGEQASAALLLERVAAQARLVTDDMAAMILQPSAGVTTGGFRSEQLEVDPGDVEAGLAERFMHACGCTDEPMALAAAEVRAALPRHGGAVIDVTYGVTGPTICVEPRPVQSGSEPTLTSILPVF